MRRDVAVAVLVLVTTIAVFTEVQPILPSNSENFSELGVLGPSMVIGGYPTNVTQGSSIHLFAYVGNHEGAVTYYQVEVKLGNLSTRVSNTTAADALEISSYPLILANNQSSTFPVNLGLSTVGTNQRLIFELWTYDTSDSQFAYSGLWDQVWINVTGGP